MKCMINGGTVFRQYNSSGGGVNRNCSDTADNVSAFYEGSLQTHMEKKIGLEIPTEILVKTELAIWQKVGEPKVFSQQLLVKKCVMEL